MSVLKNPLPTIKVYTFTVFKTTGVAPLLPLPAADTHVFNIGDKIQMPSVFQKAVFTAVTYPMSQ